MADPRLYDASAAAELQAASDMLRQLLDDVPGSDALYDGVNAAPTMTGVVFGSPVSLLEAVADDPSVRSEHGPTILVGALVRVVEDLKRETDGLRDRVEELEAGR